MVVEYLLTPLLNVWNSFVAVIPGIVGALVVLLLGYVLGWVVGLVVERALDKLQLNRCVIGKTNFCKVTGDVDLAHVIGLLLKWSIFILFLSTAASLIRLDGVAEFLTQAAL